MIKALADIRDELVRQRAASVGTPDRVRAAEVAADKRQALAIVRAVLDDWIKNQRDSMHRVYEHGDEASGSECWRSFAPSEIRTMINHAARELGVAEFPDPDQPEEDKPCA